MASESQKVRAWHGRSHPVWLYRTAQLLVGWLVRLVCMTSRRGTRRLPRKGPVILASNHTSNIDPLLVVCCMPRTVHHMAKHTLFRSRFGRFFFETLGGQIPVNREQGGNEAAFVAGVTVLQRGLALGIYPEGARARDGRLGTGHTGVARLAYATGAPIYPVALVGTHRMWPRGTRFPWLLRRTRVEVGRPIEVAADAAAADDPAACRQLTERVMEGLRDVLGPEADAPTTRGWRLRRHPNR